VRAPPYVQSGIVISLTYGQPDFLTADGTLAKKERKRNPQTVTHG
jgi:hypothetical protein